MYFYLFVLQVEIFLLPLFQDLSDTLEPTLEPVTKSKAKKTNETLPDSGVPSVVDLGRLKEATSTAWLVDSEILFFFNDIGLFHGPILLDIFPIFVEITIFITRVSLFL